VTDNSTHIQGGHLQEGSKTGLVGWGLRPPRDSTRTTLLSQSWQPGRLMSIAGPMKSQIGELVPSTLARHSTPCELGDTSARRGYDSKLANGPISIQICISWCMPTLIPACQLRMSLNEGRVSCNGDGGRWGYSPSSSSSLSQDSGSEEVSSPLALASIWAALQACLLYFCARNFSSRAQ
jgi:hypothetical protein